MNNNLTDVTLLLDRSGSMQSRRSDVVGGIGAFIEKQKTGDGECKFTLIQFDSENPQEVIYNARDIRFVSTEAEWYQPRGGTPLLDALGMAIVNTGTRLRAMPESERPGKVVFVVVTDGYENSSREYRKPHIKEMIERQQGQYSWDFVFLGANIDAVKEGASIGTLSTNSVQFGMSNVGETIAMVGSKVQAYRSSHNKGDLSYSVQERAELMDEKKDSKTS